MCGILGVVSNAPVNQLIYDALLFEICVDIIFIQIVLLTKLVSNLHYVCVLSVRQRYAWPGKAHRGLKCDLC